MSKNAIKVLAAIVIWVTAGYFAYTYYKRLFPDLPNRTGRGARAGRTWEHPDKEIASFMKADPPSTLLVKVKRSRPGTGKETFQTTDRERTHITVVKGQSVAEAYAVLIGQPRWKVTQLPMDRNRWDVFVRTPKPAGGEGQRGGGGQNLRELREESARRFLSYLRWESKTGKRPATRYRFRPRTEADGPAPLLAEFSGRPDRYSSRRWKPQLGQVLGMVTSWAEEPVVLAAAREVRDRQPNLGANEEFKVPDLISTDQTVRFLCALYGVACDKSEGEVDAFLVYHPKYVDMAEVRAWEEGKPVTREEKARAAEAAAEKQEASTAGN